MIGVKSLSFLLLLTMSVFVNASAQITEMNFSNVLADHEISIGEIEVVHQCKDGFIWVGTPVGLFRYDNSEFREIYLNHAGDLESIPHTNDIVEDREGNLFLATSGGLIKVSHDTYFAEHLDIGEVNNPNLKDLTIHNNIIYAASRVGVLVVDPTTNKTVVLNSENASFPTDEVLSVFLNNNILWIGTSHGLTNFDITDGETSKEIIEVLAQKTQKDVIHSIAQVDAHLLLGTEKGLVVYNTFSSEVKRYQSDDANERSLGGDIIWHLFVDSRKRIWLGTNQGGLNLFDLQTETFQRFKHNPQNIATSLASNTVYTVFEDKEGDIWTGNYPSGLHHHDVTSQYIRTISDNKTSGLSLNHASVLTITEDKRGKLYIGTDGGGLSVIDRKNNSTQYYTYVKNNKNSISSKAVLSSHLDSKGMLWLGTWAGGVSVFDTNGKTFTRLPFHENFNPQQAVTHSDKLNSAHVWTIYEDRRGDMWFGTHDGGLNRLDIKTGVYTHYHPIEGQADAISSDFVTAIHEDSKGNFWVATVRGLSILDRTNGTFKHFDMFSQTNVTSLHELDDHVWIATRDGLAYYNTVTGELSDGFISEGFSDPSLFSVESDHNGALWLGTVNGVTIYDPKTQKTQTINKVSSRRLGRMNRNASYLDKNGNILMGGVAGLQIIDTKLTEKISKKPTVAFTGFQIFANTIKPADESGYLINDIQNTQAINLNYEDAMFTFSFATLSYRDPERNQYRYKLDGFDTDWIDAGNTHIAKYTNLDAGTYTFHVQGANRDGVWSESRSIEITQSPAPWATWWAYLTYAFVALFTLFLLAMWQIRKRVAIEQQNLRLAREVKKATSAISKKNDDIQHLLSAMSQGFCSINSYAQILDDYSPLLEEIFNKDELAGMPITKLLFAHADIPSNNVDQIQQALVSMVGEDRINFDFNYHLLPDQFSIIVDNTTKHLELDWQPIYNRCDIIEKIMISVRDVSELKAIEETAALRERELIIVSQLLNISRQKYVEFESTTSNYIQQMLNSLVSPTPDFETIKRNLHTIKGAARTIGFTFIAEFTHEVETKVIENIASGTEERNATKEALHKLEDAIEEYSIVYYDILGRDNNEDARQLGFWLEQSAMEAINTQLAKIKNQHSGLIDAVLPIETVLNKAQSERLDSVLTDVIAGLDATAKKLGKPAPSVSVMSSDIRIKNVNKELIQSCFTHILTNAVDHGIEHPELRLATNKTEHGNIVIKGDVTNEKLSLVISDDGSGIDIEGLYQKGLEAGYWTSDKRPTDNVIAMSIFRSGVTTKESVTDISGRGVGLNAVYDAVVNAGGKIEIELNKTINGRRQFAIHISLPASITTMSSLKNSGRKSAELVATNNNQIIRSVETKGSAASIAYAARYR